VEVHGAVLVWGAVSDEGRRSVMEHYGFADVLSLEEMVRDLRDWRNPEWAARLAELRTWTEEMLDALGVSET
jgi:hypothetical protein